MGPRCFAQRGWPGNLLEFTGGHVELRILPNKASIMAAIALMPPMAREAAELLAHRLTQDRSLVTDHAKLESEWMQACAISFARAGSNPVKDQAAFQNFLDNHGHGVLNVAFSIVHVTARDSSRKRWYGWLTKAAAAGAGAAVAVFFG
jgi:hypothetical protein